MTVKYGKLVYWAYSYNMRGNECVQNFGGGTSWKAATWNMEDAEG
jgi:hypothetical protein